MTQWKLSWEDLLLQVATRFCEENGYHNTQIVKVASQIQKAIISQMLVLEMG
jgi:hypothetical protein